MKLGTEIPKKIHYCWFGGGKKPASIDDCILSWKKYFPGYEIKEWNENNFNINICDFVREAYEAKKWAFVSDFARMLILYQEGGIYFDTDVEVIKSLDDIISDGSFMGLESGNSKNCLVVNPGLGLAAYPKMEIYKEILDKYYNTHFIRPDGTYNQAPIGTYVTDILITHGWKNENTTQKIQGITIYPIDFFCPLDYQTGKLNITDNTRSIHHYTATWHTDSENLHHLFGQKVSRMFGNRVGQIAEQIYGFPYQFMYKVKQIGFVNTIKFIIEKLRGMD